MYLPDAVHREVVAMGKTPVMYIQNLKPHSVVDSQQPTDMYQTSQTPSLTGKEEVTLLEHRPQHCAPPQCSSVDLRQ